MKIKTHIWQENLIREHHERVLFWLTTISLTNIILYIIYENWIMLTINTIPGILYILTTKSHEKWKEEQKCKQNKS